MEQQLAYSIAEFCRLHQISRASLYNYWREGVGPTVMKVGSRRLISLEAAQRWRREREAAAAEVA